MKNWNKHYLIIRILSFPLKLVFQILWGFLLSILQSLHWVKFGSQELLYGKDQGKSIIKLIETNEYLVELLKQRDNVQR